MAFEPFNTRSDSPSDKAFKRGVSPYNKTLGSTKELSSVDYKNGFVAGLKDSPEFPGFYSAGRFDDKTSELSQQKINMAASTNNPNFANPEYNNSASGFLAKYAQGVNRGLIEPDKAISSAGLIRLTQQSATEGSSERDPNTANRFPDSSVAPS